MNKQKGWLWIVDRLALAFLAALLLAGCASQPRVGALQSESQSVELGGAKSVRAEIDLGAGSLDLTGGSAKLMEADFTYNVAKLKPEVAYTDGTLTVRQPEALGLPALQNITDFRNEWSLRLNNDVPMDLKVTVGGGVSNLKLAGLSLTGLDISLGAGQSTVDLSGNWEHNLDIAIDSGAGNLIVHLPKDVGVHVTVESGPHTIDAAGLTQDGDVFTNAAYGVSDVTLQINIKAGIGSINLE